MGFLRKIFTILLVSALFAGCASVIKVPESNQTSSHKMLGKSGARDFYYKGNYSDSIKLCWIGETHGGYANTSITIKDNAVFIGDLSGRVMAFDYNTGKEIGELKYKGSVNSAIITNNTLIVFTLENPNSTFTSVIYYDIRNGNEYKEIKIAGKITSELIFDDDNLFFNTQEGDIYIYNLKGEELWYYKTNSKILSSLACTGNLLTAITTTGKLMVFDLLQQKLVSTIQLDGIFEGGTSIKESILYCVNNSGIVYAVDLTEDRVKWKFDSRSRMKTFPVIDSANVYIANLKGDLYSINAKTGVMNWVLFTEGLFDAAPAVTGNLLIVPDQNKKVLFVSKNDGRILRTLTLDGRVKLSPVIKDNFVFFGYEKGKIAKYEFVK